METAGFSSIWMLTQWLLLDGTILLRLMYVRHGWRMCEKIGTSDGFMLGWDSRTVVGIGHFLLMTIGLRNDGRNRECLLLAYSIVFWLSMLFRGIVWSAVTGSCCDGLFPLKGGVFDCESIGYLFFNDRGDMDKLIFFNI